MTHDELLIQCRKYVGLHPTGPESLEECFAVVCKFYRNGMRDSYLAHLAYVLKEYVSSLPSEADQRDAARYRWLVENAELLPYPDQWQGKEWLDEIIDRAVRDGKL